MIIKIFILSFLLAIINCCNNLPNSTIRIFVCCSNDTVEVYDEQTREYTTMFIKGKDENGDVYICKVSKEYSKNVRIVGEHHNIPENQCKFVDPKTIN